MNTLALKPTPPAGSAPALIVRKSSDLRVRRVATSFAEFAFRAPMKFGGMILDRVTLLNVECEVALRDGRVGRGFGSMPLSNVWAFRSDRLTDPQTMHAMTQLAERCRRLCAEHGEFGDPIELGVALEAQFLAVATDVSHELNLADPIPPLATLVTGSPFDAAIHDAYGKAHGLSCYRTYTRDFLNRDLGAHLGPAFAGEWPGDGWLTQPQPRLALYHAVGALDPLTSGDVARPVGDGLPETLAQWIDRSGLTHLKIKLNGDDLAWDLARVTAIHGVAEAAPRAPGARPWRYSLDFNERCASVAYLVEFLRRLRESVPTAFARLELIEQPMHRDLDPGPAGRVHEAASLCPIVIDESLTGLDSVLLAHELGYTGIALKACKGQTQSLLMAAAARRLGLSLCVQDLGCPGASLIHSAGLAAHLPGIDSLESNSRQFCPAANAGWEDRFPGIFRVTDGQMDTSALTGPGLGAVPPAAARNGTHP
jgi:L-alanine-DL-glutamate epimerase-like enolase superfamily enzyme